VGAPSTLGTTSPGGARFGTLPVFLTSLSTILGAILFLRFGYAVGNVGLLGALLVILIGHLVTVPTAMAIAEIATNQRVAGGGEYYILSRSFGIITGASIGIALFLARAVSVAFYVIAFAEAFGPALGGLEGALGLPPGTLDKRLVSVPAITGLTALILKSGAKVGMKALYGVVSVLFLSLVFFFLGSTGYARPAGLQVLTDAVPGGDSLFLVFAICFPAFTGISAGVGLSGDLRDPGRSIPVGTLAATFAGMAIYVLVAVKLAVSASPADLAGDQLVMSRIALWGPVIPIGLACATLSSAIGSYLAAPRTLQAIAQDGIFPSAAANRLFSRIDPRTLEPVPATLLTAGIALAFVLVGDVDFVAQIISMFFIITYGSICGVSALQHFAADPAYRPVFRSRWYVSAFGAFMSLWVMFQISQGYAVLALFVMLLLYVTISHLNEDMRGLSNIVQGAIFQLSRQLQVFLQKSRKQEDDSWRPAVVCLSRASFERLGAFELLSWISYRYGFGTYVHYLPGYVSRATKRQSGEDMRRLVEMAHASGSNVYLDTMISPSYTTAIAQLLQLPGISGKENNMVLFEFSKEDPGDLDHIVDNYQLVSSLDFDVGLLGTSRRGFGYRRQLHVWLTPGDYENASLMILLAYVLLGHPDWKGGVIKVFSILQSERLDEERERLYRLIRSGRLPISASNVELIPQEAGKDRRAIVNARSRDADLVIVGFRGEAVRRGGPEVFKGYEGVGNVLFLNTKKEIEIVKEGDETVEDVPEGAPPPQ
jgi:amino acid transporter